MKNRILIVPLIAALMLFTAASPGQARSPYVPNYFSYDPGWSGDLPRIGGYVDAYVTYMQNWDNFNMRGAEQAMFTVDRAELFLQHRATDWADGYFEFSVTGFDLQSGGTVTHTDVSLDEAWLRVVVPWGEGLTLLGGVYDVPIGIGANETIDIWNWSFKMANLLVAPWSFTGGLVEYEMGPANINFWIGNDWGFSEAAGASRTGRVNPDKELVYGGRVGFSPDEMFDVGISVVWGNERLPLAMGGTGSWQSRTLVDLDFRWLDLPDFLGAADLELWWLELTDTPVVGNAGFLRNAQAYGAVVQLNFATPWEVLSVSLGYEYLHEEDGVVLGTNASGMAQPHQTRQSVEITPICAIGDHVIVAVSWRTDWSTKDIFVNADGALRDFTWLAAWEWYYYF